MFEPILEAIRRHDRIVLHRHVNPDGDALGSQIGLKHILRENFPDKQVRAVGDGAGFTRALSQASANGLYGADRIIGKE